MPPNHSEDIFQPQEWCSWQRFSSPNKLQTPANTICKCFSKMTVKMNSTSFFYFPHNWVGQVCWNVLIDDIYVAHLVDYGLDRLMSPSAAAEMMAAASIEGYKAPKLQKMKRANTNTDIYSFGILLLEILMGKKPGISATGSDEIIVDLPGIVKAAVLEERTTQVFHGEILRALRNPLDDELPQALRLAMGCCAPSPSVRPDIKEVIRHLEELRPKMHSPLYTPRTPRGCIPD